MTSPGPSSLAPHGALEGRLRLMLALPIVLSLLLSGALVAELFLVLGSAGGIDHTDRVIAQARAVGVRVAAAQVPGSEEADRALSAAVGVLGRLVAADAAQAGRQQELAATVDRWFQQRSVAGTVQLNRQLGDFIAVEEHLRDQRARRTRQLSRALVVGTLLGAVVLGGLLGLFGRRNLRAVASQYEAALEHARKQTVLRSEEERFRQLIEAVEDYAIFLLDADGNVASWNAGAERNTGWHADEIMGRPFELFFAPDDRAAGTPKSDLETAAGRGALRGEARRVRKDGSQFLADVVLTAVRDSTGRMVGFVSIAHDVTERRRNEVAIATLNRELEQRVAELAAANAELETFSYTVSHDLRGPLRAIDGFAKILMDEYRAQLDPQGQHYLARVRAGSQRMGHLIDALLSLARVTRTEMSRSDVDLAQIAREVIDEQRRHAPARVVDVVVVDRAPASGDPRLLRTVLENLLANAWKFTGKTAHPRIEVGVETRDGARAFFVRDNGAGFDMSYGHKLFTPFQRLHEQSDFEGTGIGLATVQRAIARHGGKLWAESTPGQGATFWFTV